MALSDSGKAPYAPARAVETVINQARERGLTTPVTLAVLERCGIEASLTKRTLASLKQLDLLNDDGSTTPTFDKLRIAPTDEFQPVVADWLKDAYKPIFSYVEPTDDVVRITDQFRHYEPQGMRNRMVTLFLGLCVLAGLVDKVPPIPRKTTGTPNGAKAKAPAKPKIKGGPLGTDGVGALRQEAHGREDPPVDPRTPPPPPPPPPDTGLDPLLAAYVSKLPAPGPWSSAEQEKWLTGIKTAFALIYTEDGDP